MATTKITLNGAYLLGTDSRISDFNSALESFVGENPSLTNASSLKTFKANLDLSKTLNIGRALTYYSNFDNKAAIAVSNAAVGESATDDMALIGKPDVPAIPKTADSAAVPAVAAVAGTWLPKVKGLDAYDTNATTLQTVNLYNDVGATLIMKTQNKDAKNTSSSYDFTSSNGVIHLTTNATTSNAAPVAPATTKSTKKTTDVNTTIDYYDTANSIVYTNLGEIGATDDTKSSLSQTSHSVFTTKDGVFNGKISYTDLLSYYDKDYKVEITVKKDTASDFASFSSVTHNTTISKYAFLSNELSLSLAGNITGSWGGDGNTEAMALTGINLQTADYNLKTDKLTYKQTYNNADYYAQSGLTNIDSYNFITIETMQEDITTRVIPKILTGNNTVTLKQATSFDAGAGNDKITGTNDGDELIGGSGNDVLIGNAGGDNLTGGAGIDKLTGGKDGDTFSFQTSDFLTENKNGDLVFNKSVDTITDFKPKDGDTLSFGDMGDVAFFKNLSMAKSEQAPLFYIKGKIYFDTNPADDIYTPTVIVKLTGNPKVSTDFTGWETA